IHELQAIRQGKWKLHLPHTYESVEKAGNEGQRGKTIQKRIELSLYDLEKDPQEKNNIYAQHPEKVTQLKTLLKKYIQEGRSTKGRPQPYTQVANWPGLSWL
ncbi:MAG: arylsulfatase, partial [Runella zeae]